MLFDPEQQGYLELNNVYSVHPSIRFDAIDVEVLVNQDAFSLARHTTITGIPTDSYRINPTHHNGIRSVLDRFS